MLLPPEHVRRDEPPPDDLLLFVRGGKGSLSDLHLANQVGDCWDRHRFFGVSVFGAPDDDLVALCRAIRAIRVRPVVRFARVGDIRNAGFEAMPTFPNPHHFSVVLPNAAPSTFVDLRRCFTEPQPNVGFEPES